MEIFLASFKELGDCAPGPVCQFGAFRFQPPNLLISECPGQIFLITALFLFYLNSQLVTVVFAYLNLDQSCCLPDEQSRQPFQ
jgi:hypothetical protein